MRGTEKNGQDEDEYMWMLWTFEQWVDDSDPDLDKPQIQHLL